MSFIQEYLQKRQARYTSTDYAEAIQEAEESAPVQSVAAGDEVETPVSTTDDTEPSNYAASEVATLEEPEWHQQESYEFSQPSSSSEQGYDYQEREPITQEELQIREPAAMAQYERSIPEQPRQQVNLDLKSPEPNRTEYPAMEDPEENYLKLTKSLFPSMDEVSKYLKLDESEQAGLSIQYEAGVEFAGYLEQSFQSVSEGLLARNERDIQEIMAVLRNRENSETDINLGMRSQI